MKLTIIETGLVPEPIRAEFDDYPAMFAALLGAADPSLQFETVSVVKGERLPHPERCEALLITGSPAGVYDSYPWIADLEAFIKQAAKASIPQIGICFGHQIMAQALGGKVEKSKKGWGIGLHKYEMLNTPDWAEDIWPAALAVAVSHQDQVVSRPPGAILLARSDFTEYAGLYFPDAPAISFQCHPEFAANYSTALYNARRERMGGPAVDAAIASLEGASDRAHLGEILARFLLHHQESARRAD